eukprot:5289664-Pyramimonas_sp.AAC.1
MCCSGGKLSEPSRLFDFAASAGWGCGRFRFVPWCRRLGAPVGPEANVHRFPNQCDKCFFRA